MGSNLAHASEAGAPRPRTFFGAFRARLLQGLFVVLPVAVTFGIVAWLYGLLRNTVIAPIARIVVDLATPGPDNDPLPVWFESVAAPLIAILLVVGLLYVAGLFLNSRVHQLFDWLLMRVPVVTTIYSAVVNVVKTMQRTGDAGSRFQRVVLVPFPHPGVKAPAFVTSTCEDVATGKTIVCVYVPTTPVPTSGYMLMYPEEEVTEVSWDLNETLQAIVSGGLTVPPRVEYYPVAGSAK